MKIRIIILFLLLFVPFIFAEEIYTTDSPDGKYAFFYTLNGKSNRIIRSFQSYDFEDYDFHVYDKKTKKEIYVKKSIPWVDKIVWAPDSGRIAIQSHTKYSSDIAILNIKTKETKGIDFWQYILQYAVKYKFQLLGSNPYPINTIQSWSADGKKLNVYYEFNTKNGRQKGYFIYDVLNDCILNLVPRKTG